MTLNTCGARKLAFAVNKQIDFIGFIDISDIQLATST